jgi:hypothetical protein
MSSIERLAQCDDSQLTALRGPNGFPVGSLCILATKPRTMTTHEQNLIKMIAGDAMEQIMRRRVVEMQSTLASEKV